MDLASLEFNAYSLIGRCCVSELLVIHAQRAGESHFEVIRTWALGIEDVVVNQRSFKGRILKSATREFRSVETGCDETTSCEIARIKHAVSQVASVKNRILEIDLRESLALRHQANE